MLGYEDELITIAENKKVRPGVGKARNRNSKLKKDL